MIEPDIVQQVLSDSMAGAREAAVWGRVAGYIPELRNVDPSLVGASVAFPDQCLVSAGDCASPFTLQSIAKVPCLGLALETVGFEAVFEKVGMEPAAEPYYSVARLERLEPNRPFNPMINAGAIAVCGLLAVNGAERALRDLTRLVARMAGEPELEIDERVWASERDTGHRNRALAHLLKDLGLLASDVEDALELYFGMCSIRVCCGDVARIGLSLAQGGRDPRSGEQLLSKRVSGTLLSLMMTCGMYDASGTFAIRVGLPAKSGVSGGIVACLPKELGIGVFGPALDPKGNSSAGTYILEQISERLRLHLLHGG